MIDRAVGLARHAARLWPKQLRLPCIVSSKRNFSEPSMGGGPSSEVKGQSVQLVWTTTIFSDCKCCPGLKTLQGEVPAWLKSNFEKIVELGAPYGSCICCQMNNCGSPCFPSPFEDESQNEPLKAMRSQFPQYVFSFRAEWVGMGKHANWQHVLQISNSGAVVGEVVGVPGQQNM